MLQRHLTWTKWRALGLIVCASILVSTPSLSSPDNSHADCDGEHNNNNNGHRLLVESGDGDEFGAGNGHGSSGDGSSSGGGGDLSLETAIGFGAVLLEVTLSGFASIYFEKVLVDRCVK